MKVLVFANGSSGSGPGTSGSGQILIEYCKWWNQNGHLVLILTPEGDLADQLREAGIRVSHNFSPISRPLQSAWAFGLAYLLRAAKSCFVDVDWEEGVIYCPSDFYCDVLPAISLKVRKPKFKIIVGVYHLIPAPSRRVGEAFFVNMLSYLAQQLSLWLLREKADLVFTESSVMKEALIQRGFLPAKVQVKSGGVDLDKVDSVKALGDAKYDACIVARLHPTKGYFDLFSIWKAVCETKKDARLAIIGTGLAEWRERFRHQIEAMHLAGNITMLGFVEDRDKYRVLKSSKLFVFTSYEEGVPIVFYEAMACGLPIVSYYLPTYKDIKNVILPVPLGDIHAFANAVLQVLVDEPLRDRLIRVGRCVATKHTWSKLARDAALTVEGLYGR